MKEGTVSPGQIIRECAISGCEEKIFDISCHALMTKVRCEKMQKEFLHEPAFGSDRPS